MSCLDDSDDHLTDGLNLDYMGITHLDCVTRVYKHVIAMSSLKIRRKSH